MTSQPHGELGYEIDLKMSLKCVKPSPDGKHVACGDATGRVAIYNTETSEEINQFQAHEQEVVCLDYSPFLDPECNYILASGSRDRHTHMYSSENGYIDINTLEGHSSSIVSVKFAFDPEETNEAKRLKLITSGADKAIIYRKVEDYETVSTYHKEVFKNNKVVAMDVKENRLICGHDKMVTVTNISQKLRTYEKKVEKIKPTGSQDFTQVCLDASNTFLVSSSTDRYFTIQDMISGALVTKGTCGELTT